MTPKALRPIDLAREHGLSAQAVRNYEDDGILPPAGRSASGYRQYTAAHARALRAFLALRAGYGHRTATEILRAANRGDDGTLFRLIDEAHAELLHERDVLDQVAAALGDLTAAPAVPSGDGRGELSIGALAHRLGMHPASLRKWEDTGLLRPRRDPTGQRRYAPDDVRDAHVVHQLRRGGYPLSRIKVFIDQLRSAGTTTDLEEILAEWRVRLRHRGRAMLAAGAHLDDYLEG